MNESELQTSIEIARVLSALFYLVFALILFGLDEVFFHSGLSPVQRLGLFLLGGFILNFAVGRIVRQRSKAR